MIRINLLGREAEKQKRGLRGLSLENLGASPTQIGIGAMLTSVFIVLAVAWWYQSGRLEEVRADLARVTEERARLEEVATRVESLQERTDLIRDKLMVIVELKASQTGPVMLLDQVSRLLTDGLWLTRLQLEDGGVDIRGAALSEVTVADFVANLELSEYFTDVRLRTVVDSGEQMSFQVTFAFDPTPDRDGLPLASSLNRLTGGR